MYLTFGILTGRLCILLFWLVGFTEVLGSVSMELEEMLLAVSVIAFAPPYCLDRYLKNSSCPMVFTLLFSVAILTGL